MKNAKRNSCIFFAIIVVVVVAPIVNDSDDHGKISGYVAEKFFNKSNEQ